MKKTAHIFAVICAALLSFTAFAKDAPVNIGGNQTSFSDADLQTLAANAKKMGVKEPINVSSADGGATLVFKGAAGTCRFKVEPGTTKMKGISCNK